MRSPSEYAPEQLPELIESAQRILRWTDAALAEEWGCNKETVGRWKRLDNKPPLYLVDALSGLLERRGMGAAWRAVLEKVTPAESQ